MKEQQAIFMDVLSKTRKFFDYEKMAKLYASISYQIEALDSSIPMEKNKIRVLSNQKNRIETKMKILAESIHADIKETI